MSGIALYHKYHVDRQDERLGMFKRVAEQFTVERVLYPGSFVHLTPSFVFPVVTYVDSEKRASKFFSDSAAAELVRQRKLYSQDSLMQFHHQDYGSQLPESDESFELLISQYGGFVSQQCKRYLKIGGLLLVNNSHGDAGMAHFDDDYELVAVISRRGEKFSLTEKDLKAYFVPKKEIPITKEYLQRIQRGIGYQKSAFAYLFRRVG